MALATGAALLLVYLLTLAPGVTFWDAGEFIAAAHGFGIPHPPGTPLYIALARALIVAIGPLMSAAYAANLLSALCTAAAGGLTAWMIAHAARGTVAAAWGAAACGILAGVMCSAWANATETEVYAFALLHAVAMLACALRAGAERGGARWLGITLYLIALAPAVHLSALVAAPAAAAMAARRTDDEWDRDRVFLLAGAMTGAAGVGRMSLPLVVTGLAIQCTGWWLARDDAPGGRTTPLPTSLLLGVLGASALLVLLVRARHDPYVNQGNPVTVSALADVVARRQYAVAGLLPRQAPLWLQGANVAQYADWQIAMGWGHGVFTTPLRVAATIAYVALGIIGWRAMRFDAPRLSRGLVVLLVCGTLGVAAYLNLRPGASLGWGLLPDDALHEARERDYFFVLGFWAWACFAGWGALAWARRTGHGRLALVAALVPLVANWSVVDRSRAPVADAARTFAAALLGAAPPHAVLFTSGDNDSYPLWYLQGVEGVRPDVQLVTMPLLPAAWYEAEVARRTGWQWDAGVAVPGALWRHEQTAAAIARAARAAGRPVAASPAITVRERALLGAGWVLRGPVYVSTRGLRSGTADTATAQVDRATADVATASAGAGDTRAARLPDDVSSAMLGLLECPRLGGRGGPAGVRAESLEVRCNFR